MLFDDSICVWFLTCTKAGSIERMPRFQRVPSPRLAAHGAGSRVLMLTRGSVPQLPAMRSRESAISTLLSIAVRHINTFSTHDLLNHDELTGNINPICSSRMTVTEAQSCQDT